MIGLDGTLTITRGTGSLSVDLQGTSASATITVNDDGTFSATGQAELSLPIDVPGVSLSGTATFGVDSSQNLELSLTNGSLATPVGTISGAFDLVRHGDVWDIEATTLSLFLGQRGATSADDIGVTVSGLTLAARLLPSGDLVLWAQGGTIAVTGVSGVTLTGSLTGSYNPTNGTVTVGTTTTHAIAAHTASLAGSLTFVVAGASLGGTFAVTRQGTGDATVVTVDAENLTGSVGTQVTLTGGALHVRLTKNHWTLDASGAVGITGVTGVSASGALAVRAGTGLSTTITGTGLRLQVGPVTATGTVSLTVAAGVATITIADGTGTLAVDGLVSVTGIGGTVVVGTSIDLHTASDATINVGPVTITGPVSLSSTTGIAIGTSGTPATISVAGQTITGTVSVGHSSGGATQIGVTITNLDFAGVLTLSSGSLDLTVSPAGVVGDLSIASTTTVTVGDLSLTAPLTLHLDTTGPTPLFSLTVGNHTTHASATLTGLGTLSGIFTVQQQADALVVAMTEVGASITTGSASLADGSGVLVVPTGATGIAGYLSGSITLAGNVAQGTARLNTTSGGVDVTVDVGGTPMRVVFGADEHGVFSVAVSGSLDFGPVSIEGTVSFTTNTTTGHGIFGGTGLTVFFGDGPLTLGNGERNPAARGLLIEHATVGVATDGAGKYALDATGDVSVIGLPGLTLSGGVHVRFNTMGASVNETIPVGNDSVVVVFTQDNVAEVAGTGLTLKVMGQELSGDLSITHRADGGLTITASHLAATLRAGGTPVLALSNGGGTLTLTSLGVKATGLTATVDVTVPGVAVAATATFTLDIDTTPTGPAFSFATTGSLTIEGVSITGGFTVTRTVAADGSATTSLTLTNAGVQVKSSPTAVVLGLTNVNGSVAFGSGGLAGNLSGTIDTGHAGPSGLSLSGTISVEVDTAAGRFALDAHAVNVTVAGQTLHADLAVRRSLDATGNVELTVEVSAGSITLPGVSVTDVTGSFTSTATAYSGTLSGTLAVTAPYVVAGGTLAVAFSSTGPLSIAGTGLNLQVAGQRLSGDVSVSVSGNVTTVTVSHAAFDFGGGLLTLDDAAASVVLTKNVSTGTSSLTSLSLSGTPALHVPGLDVTATAASVDVDSAGAISVGVTNAALVASGLELHADLSIATGTDATGARTITVTVAAATDGSAFLDLAGVITVATATGTLHSTAQGTTGDIVLANPTFDASTFGGSAHADSVHLALDGASTSIEILGASLALGGVTLTGSVAIDHNGGTTRFAFTDVELATGSSADARLTAATGGFVVAPGGGTGVAGVLTATLHGSFSGVNADGTVYVRVNTTGGAVNESIQVGGRTVAIVFDAATQGVSVSLIDATFDVGGFLTIQGSMSNGSCGTGCTYKVGQGLRIFVGRGPAFIAGGELNPLATGVLVSDATVGVVSQGSGYAVVATGTVRLVGVDGVTLVGTVSVRWNDSGVAVDQSLAIPGTTADPVLVKFDTTDVVRSFSLTGATIGVLGQSFTADLAVDRTAAGDTVLAFHNAAITLGPARLTGGEGMFLLGSTGLAGRVSGNLSLDVPGVGFGAGLSLAINTRPDAVHESIEVGTTTSRLDLAGGPYLRLDGTGITLTVLEQTITADVSVTRTATATTIGLANVSLDLLANGYGATLRNGTGVLVVGAAGVGGHISGTIGLALPARVSASGSLALAINTATAPLTTSVDVGGSTLTLDLPGGPYLRFEATALRLTVAGQTLTGDFAFEKLTTPGGGSVIRIAGAHVALDLAGILRLTDGSALVVLTDAGLGASISGTIALAVPGVSIDGDLAVQLNTTSAEVHSTFVVAGVPSTLDLPTGSYVRVAGTNLHLVVLGQTLSGDLVITRTADAAGRPVLRIEASNLALVLGGGSSTMRITQHVTSPGDKAVLVIAPDGVTADIAVDIAVTVPNVHVGGTVHLHIDTAAGVVRASGDNVDLDVLGQRLSGSFAFEQSGPVTARVVKIGVSNASLALGPITAEDITGLFVLANGGVAGRLSTRLDLGTNPVVDLRGTFGLALNTTGVAVHQSLTVGSGDVALDLPAGPYLQVSGTGVVIRPPDSCSAATWSWRRPGAASTSPPTTSGSSSATASAPWSGSPTDTRTSPSAPR